MSHIFGNTKMSNTSISKNLTGNTLTAFKGCVIADICATTPKNADLIHPVSEISISTTLTDTSSGHIIHTMNDVVITLPLATKSKGVYYIFILPEGTTSAKWIVSGGDKIHGPLTSGGKVIKTNNVSLIEMGTLYGKAEDGSPGDKVVFKCNGLVWFVDGISQLDAFQFPSFSLTVSSSMIETSGVLSDQNKVINQTQNVNIRNTSTFQSNFLGTAAFIAYDFSSTNASESLIVVIDGTSTTHTIGSNCDTVANTAQILTTLIPGATITSVYGSRLKITSDTQGAHSTIAITASGSGTNALKLFGSINSGTGTISWNWNSTNAYNLGGFTLANLKFIQFGLDPSDTAVSPTNSNDGTTWNGKIQTFIDKHASSYTNTSNSRVIDLHPFKTIIDNNLDNASPNVSASQIIDSSCCLDSITIYFKTGNDSNGGRAPDMDTNLKYGRMTAPENLWIEFHDDAYNSIQTPTSKQYGKGARLSNLQALYATKNDLHYSMVDYDDLSHSPLYTFAIGQGQSFSGNITQIPSSQYWHAGAGTIGGTPLSDLETKPGWNTPQPDYGGHSTYALTYGNASTLAVGKSFVYNANNPNLSGIYGAARTINGLSTKLWDETKSLIEQPSFNRNQNVSLVSDVSSSAYPGHPILGSIRYGNVGRNMNIPDPNWVKVTIDNIPKEATKVRIFQDRYTGGGTPPHDNYAIGSVKITLTGTYKAS